MIHEFELVKDSFKQFFIFQRKVKEKIETIDKLQGNQLHQVRLSFRNEMKAIVSRYVSWFSTVFICYVLINIHSSSILNKFFLISIQW